MGNEFSARLGLHTYSRNSMPLRGNEGTSGYGHRRHLGMLVTAAASTRML
jgi:hypothetical protein